MIVALLGKAGAGKTVVAEALERITPNSFIIDGDDLRAETKNIDIGISGRERNMHLGYSRARWLSDLGFTVFIAMQAPIKEIRKQYLKEEDIEILITNNGPNPKDEMGYNKNFSADYSGVKDTIELTDYVVTCPVTQEFLIDAPSIYEKIIPRVLVVSRFQGFHRGHELVMEVAKRLSPDITIGLRTDPGDLFELDKNMELLRNMGYNVVKSPEITDSSFKWEQFVKDYDIVVQGNPEVIRKFQGKDSEGIDKFLINTTPSSPCDIIFDNGVHLKYVPRVGHISATKIREAIKEGRDDYARSYVPEEVFNFLKDELTE